MSCAISIVFMTIIILVNSVFVSFANRMNLTEETVTVTEIDNTPEDYMMSTLKKDQRSGFVGDLTVGNRSSEETIYNYRYVVTNNINKILTFPMTVRAKEGEFIHYLSVLNEPDYRTVSCPTPETLGSSASKFNIRLNPFSRSFIRVSVAAH